MCRGIICYPLRLYSKNSLERRIWKYKDQKGWDKYIGTGYDFDKYYININNMRLKELSKKAVVSEEEYPIEKSILFFVFDMQLIKQYKKIPDVFKIQTYLFSRLTLDVNEIIKMDFERKAVADMKGIMEKHDALYQTMMWVFDRIKYDKNLTDKNKINNLTIHHYIPTLINDNILSNIVKQML